MGLAWRSLLPGSNLARAVRSQLVQPDSSGASARQSVDQPANADGPKLRNVLRDHFLRVRRSLREYYHAAGAAAVAIRLRRDYLGPGAFSGWDFFDYDAVRRGRAVG